MNKNRHQEYLTELKKQSWQILFEEDNRNCVHPVSEYLTCGEYKNGTLLLVPQGKINYPIGYTRSREFSICPDHLSFYSLAKNDD